MTDHFSGIFGALAPATSAFQAPAQPMWNWQGRSGRWYIHTIFPLSQTLYYQGANYVMVQRLADGTRKALYIGQSEALCERLPKHEKLLPAMLLGATELHVHLVATSSSERFDIETDLRNGHNPPLNLQNNSQAGLGGLAELFGAFGLQPTGR